MNKFLLILSITAAVLSATPLKVGSPLSMMSDFKYETPRGREMRVPKKPKLIIVAFEKDTGALVNEYLNSKSPLYLPKNRSMFIADISKMPTIITNTFALPKLRKYNHLIYLHYGEKFQTVIPHREKQITLLHVEDSKIKNISFISTKEELQAAIQQ